MVLNGIKNYTQRAQACSSCSQENKSTIYYFSFSVLKYLWNAIHNRVNCEWLMVYLQSLFHLGAAELPCKGLFINDNNYMAPNSSLCALWHSPVQLLPQGLQGIIGECSQGTPREREEHSSVCLCMQGECPLGGRNQPHFARQELMNIHSWENTKAQWCLPFTRLGLIQSDPMTAGSTLLSSVFK